MYFRVSAHVGICQPIKFVVAAGSLDEAVRRAGGAGMFDGPDDDLRPLIEARMRAKRVDPELRGWHNYQVLDVEPCQ